MLSRSVLFGRRLSRVLVLGKGDCDGRRNRPHWLAILTKCGGKRGDGSTRGLSTHRHAHAHTAHTQSIHTSIQHTQYTQRTYRTERETMHVKPRLECVRVRYCPMPYLLQTGYKTHQGSQLDQKLFLCPLYVVDMCTNHDRKVPGKGLPPSVTHGPAHLRQRQSHNSPA